MASLGHPCKFQQVSRLGSVTAQHSSSGRQANFAALNRGRHLYLAGRPSRWALAHILVKIYFDFKIYFDMCVESAHNEPTNQPGDNADVVPLLQGSTELCNFCSIVTTMFYETTDNCVYVCVCVSGDKSKENVECEGSGCEEEMVIMQFVSCHLNEMHVVLFLPSAQ